MGTRRELQQELGEVIAETEPTRLQGEDNQVLRFERITWRLVGVLDRCRLGTPDIQASA